MCHHELEQVEDIRNKVHHALLRKAFQVAVQLETLRQLVHLKQLLHESIGGQNTHQCTNGDRNGKREIKKPNRGGESPCTKGKLEDLSDGHYSRRGILSIMHNTKSFGLLAEPEPTEILTRR